MYYNKYILDSMYVMNDICLKYKILSIKINCAVYLLLERIDFKIIWC